MATANLRPSPFEPAGRTATSGEVNTVADPTVGALTDSSGGTASTTLAAITGSYVEATIENTVASLAAAREADRVALVALLAELRAQGVIAT